MTNSAIYSVQTSVLVVVELELMHKIRRLHPDINALQKLEQRLCETGSLTSGTCECGSPTDSTGDSQKGAKVSALERHLWRSSRDVARKLRLSQPTFLGNLRDDEFYHFDDLQSANLFSDTRLLWMTFCKRLRHEHAANKVFVHKFCG